MKFKSEAHKQVFERARGYLHSLFGEVNVTQTDDAFALREGSTFVYVRTFPIGEQQAGVEIFSYVAIGVEVTQALMRFLLTYNMRLLFGGFGLSIDEDGTALVVLSHTILGDKMERVELYASVSAIARVADDLDDEIVGNFGGQTAFDKLMAVRHEPGECWE
jgi:T3SS (YopN, CesT) and YbjN peptide-binding chaperone 1